MKRKVILLLSVFAVMIGIGLGIVYINSLKSKNSDKDDNIKIVTSFYPTNILVKNAIKNMDLIEVSCLTESQTGCLHDYQLTTGDMKKIADADIFVINGAGMEAYIEDILKNYPDLYIIDLSKGIDLVRNAEYIEHEASHDHEDGLDNDTEDEEHNHNHGAYNAHIFTDPALYMQQLENFQTGMERYFESNSLQNKYVHVFTNNVSEYLERLYELKERLEELKSKIAGKKAIIFHDAFLYTAIRLGIDVVSFVDMESDAGLSSGEIARVIDTIKEEKVSILMIEKQFENSIAESIVKETGASLYVIDTCVTGDGSLDSYLNSMYQNIEVLQEAYR